MKKMRQMTLLGTTIIVLFMVCYTVFGVQQDKNTDVFFDKILTLRLPSGEEANIQTTILTTPDGTRIGIESDQDFGVFTSYDGSAALACSNDQTGDRVSSQIVNLNSNFNGCSIFKMSSEWTDEDDDIEYPQLGMLSNNVGDLSITNNGDKIKLIFYDETLIDQDLTVVGHTNKVTFVELDKSDETITFKKNAIFETNTFGGALGEIKMFALSISGSVTKSILQDNGWAICDGTTPVSQGITDPDITITPNLEEKFIRMSDDETSGTTGGAATHVLTIDEMPAHTHEVDCSLAAGIDADARCGVADSNTFSTNSTGGGNAHNNLPPFYEMVYFMKVKV